MSSDSRAFTEHDGAVLTPAIRAVGAEDGFEGDEHRIVHPGVDGEPTGGGAGTATSNGADAETATEEEEEEFEPLHPSAEEIVAEVLEYFESASDEFVEPPTTRFVRTHFFDFDYLERYEEIERYWVNRPFAYVTILYDVDAREYVYHVVEPTLDRFEQYVRADLVTLLRNSLMYLEIEHGEDRAEVFIERVGELTERHAVTVDDGTLQKILYYLQRDFLHYGPIDPIMRDHNVEDISCDGIDVPVFVYHREYRDLRTNIAFESRRLSSFTVQLAQRAGKSISVSDPLVDASLPDGSRIQLTLGGDVSTRGSNFTIRKFADIPYTPVDLVNWNTFSTEQMAYFWLAIENNKSLVFAGGTGSGKTTSMNAVSFFIPPSSKVVTIEDTREIDLPHQNWIQSVTRDSASADGRGEVSMYNLLQAALRQRPEYLLVGEIRTEQRVALTFFQAMGTGHTAYTTIHADSVETALSRLQNPPLSVPTQMLQDLDIISIQKQTFIGDRRVRRTATVAELGVDADDPNQIEFEEMFHWDPTEDVHQKVGNSTVLLEIARDRGWDQAELERQLADRERVLNYLVENDITDYDAVGSTIQMFARDPDAVVEAIENDVLGDLYRGAPDERSPPETVDEAVELERASADYRTWDEVVAAARSEPDSDSATDPATDPAAVGESAESAEASWEVEYVESDDATDGDGERAGTVEGNGDGDALAGDAPGGAPRDAPDEDRADPETGGDPR